MTMSGPRVNGSQNCCGCTTRRTPTSSSDRCGQTFLPTHRAGSATDASSIHIVTQTANVPRGCWVERETCCIQAACSTSGISDSIPHSMLPAPRTPNWLPGSKSLGLERFLRPVPACGSTFLDIASALGGSGAERFVTGVRSTAFWRPCPTPRGACDGFSECPGISARESGSSFSACLAPCVERSPDRWRGSSRLLLAWAGFERACCRGERPLSLPTMDRGSRSAAPRSGRDP